MSNRLFVGIAAVLFFLLSGCVYNEEAMPQIVYRPQVRPQKLGATALRSTTSRSKFGGLDASVPRGWIAPSGLERPWEAIVVHHSATSRGNAAIFDKQHREQNGWDGVGYDFVIGNGSDSGDGQVEVTFRWRQQRVGAHCKTPDNWANENAVGICLVGNFSEGSPTPLQMQSLGQLVSFLQGRYRIDSSRIYGHSTTPGAKKTACPGSNFSMWRLKTMLAK